MSSTIDHETPARPPKVSVCVITYNHEKYLRQCLQSIVDQRTDFYFEIIVGDDCSTDGTRAIISEFARAYPDIVRVVLQERNTGGTGNYLDVHSRARGEYVAHIDGDDIAYAGKLQAQANALDADPACSLVWHRMQVFNDSGSISVPNLPGVGMWPNGRVELRDLLRFGSVGYHSSTMYRATARLRSQLIEGDALDWLFAVELLRAGHGCYLEAILGGYRNNPTTGISRAGDGQVRMRRLYRQHLRHYLRQLPEFRRDIFVNCLINCLVDFINHRPSWVEFFRIALSSFSLIGLFQFPALLRRYRVIYPKIS